ncbi:MAG: hypothetical protein LUG95_06005 [Clostridiales bacterium]|nr:hypothetical protein [Clostridiales bacterium]
MRSKSRNSRITMFGEILTNDNKPVLTVLELQPTKNATVIDEIKIASAHGKDNAQNFINSSEILYIDKNKNRVNNWSKITRLQLPVTKNNINSINNSISKSDENVKIKNSFDVDEPVEEVRDLVAVHNITEKNLLKSLELGGLPMPSIAVMEARNAKGNDAFGDISLIFPREAIDPEANSDNKVYGSDVWSPTYSAVEYKLNEKKADEIYSRAKAAEKKSSYQFNVEAFSPDNLQYTMTVLQDKSSDEDITDVERNLKMIYLTEHGINIEKQIKENLIEMNDFEILMSKMLLKSIKDEFEELINGEIGIGDWLKKYEKKIFKNK